MRLRSEAPDAAFGFFCGAFESFEARFVSGGGGAVRHGGGFGVDSDIAQLDEELVKPVGFPLTDDFDMGMEAVIVERAIPLGINGEWLAGEQIEGEMFGLLADLDRLLGGDAAHFRRLFFDALAIGLAATVAFEGTFWGVHEVEPEFFLPPIGEPEHEAVAVIVTRLDEGAVAVDFVAASFLGIF